MFGKHNFVDIVQLQYDHAKEFLESQNPFVLVALSITTGMLIAYLAILNIMEKSLAQRLFEFLCEVVKKIPFVNAQIQGEIIKARDDLMETIHGTETSDGWMFSLPEEGIDENTMVQLMEKYDMNPRRKEGDHHPVPSYLKGRVSGAAFHNDKNQKEIAMLSKVFSRYAWSNPLWPVLYPAVRRMEAEVVRMTCDILHGDEQTCGTMSTGGSVSILLACLAHRNRAMARGVNFPEMILPSSAHAAFFKAGELFRIKIVKIKVTGPDFTLCPKKVESHINSRTCMIAGSAPNFPYGTVDDIRALGELSIKYDIPLHVDACLGGFLLPFLKEDAVEFDFRIPGVCSISADTHKYGLAPKGSSVVVYRNDSYRRHQFFGNVEWEGGLYASATLEGSRCGSNIALCWASLLYHGRGFYVEQANKIQEVTRDIRNRLIKNGNFDIQGASDICIVSFTSRIIDIYRLQNDLANRGWQLSCTQYPDGVHIMVTSLHCQEGVVDELMENIEECVEKIKQTPNEPRQGQGAMYGLAQSIPDGRIIREISGEYLAATYAFPPEKH